MGAFGQVALTAKALDELDFLIGDAESFLVSDGEALYPVEALNADLAVARFLEGYGDRVPGQQWVVDALSPEKELIGRYQVTVKDDGDLAAQPLTLAENAAPRRKARGR